jgi:pimeloyl-ACP methyl ester carboxylesterase
MQLIFIHGSGANAKAWKHQVSHYPNAIAISLPGHPQGDLLDSIEDMVAWLKAYVDERKLTDLVLAGHSMGGGIALQYALDHPDDLLGLVLIGSGARLRVHPDTLSFMEQAVSNHAAYADLIATFWPELAEDFAEELKAEAMAVGPRAFLADYKACDRFDIFERVGEISTPTLAIVGSADVMTPLKYAQFLARNMTAAEVTTVEGGTHYVFAQIPEKVNTAIDRFLEKLE